MSVLESMFLAIPWQRLYLPGVPALLSFVRNTKPPLGNQQLLQKKTASAANSHTVSIIRMYTLHIDQTPGMTHLSVNSRNKILNQPLERRGVTSLPLFEAWTPFALSCRRWFPYPLAVLGTSFLCFVRFIRAYLLFAEFT
jgi:hypothetical protein